ncbi:MAG: c-type cytochrome [Candidatus Acidiferrales bacterium]
MAVLAVTPSIGMFFLPRVSGASKHVPSLSRGKYLVEAVAICFECHSERDFAKPGWPIPPGRVGSGRILRGDGTPEQIIAPNISPDKATGIGAWSDEEIVRAIVGGVGHDGKLLNPEMPYRYFRVLSRTDVDSIVMYLKTIPPVSNKLPKMASYVPGKFPPGVAMDTIRLRMSSNAVKRGAYLVRLGGCETCHTPTNEQGFISGMEFAGGTVFRHGNQAAASSNLTPDLSGIGRYTEQQFIQIIKTGRSGNRPINSAMPWLFYRHLTDTDLAAIFAYLKALPPISHIIDNSQPPAFCPMCRNEPGLGNRN